LDPIGLEKVFSPKSDRVKKERNPRGHKKESAIKKSGNVSQKNTV